MCWTRNVQILSGDTHRLGENRVPERRKNRIAQNHVYARRIEDFFETKAKGDQLEKCQRMRDVDQNVDVAARPGSIAGRRSEERDLLDPEVAPQFFAVIQQEGKNLIP